MKRQTCVWAIVAAMLLPLAATSPAWAITYIPKGAAAYFEGGEGSVDTWTGIAGDGWAGGWATRKDATATTVTPTLTNASPLASGTDNYVDVDMTASAANSYVTIGRRYDSVSIDPTQDYTISSLFRIDEDMSQTFGTFFTGATDRYQLYQSSATSLASGSNNNSTWIIGAYGGTQTAGDGHTIPAGTWVLDSYPGSATTGYKYDSGISLAQGVTYSVQVTIHPDFTWDATLGNGTTTYTQTNMGFRNDALTGRYLEYCAKASDNLDTRQFSLDSVVVSQSGYNTVGGMNRIAAHFDGGNSTTVVDAYAGMAGDGWGSEWKTTSSQTTLTPTAVTSLDPGYNPLKTGTGAYLNVTTTGNLGLTTPAYGGVGRDYTRINSDGIDWTQKHTIQFTVRIDENMDSGSTTFTGDLDRYAIVDSPSVAGGTGSSNVWAIGAFGAEGTNVTADMVGQWLFANGDRAGSTVGYADSNIALTTGGVYDFTIVVDPTDKSYDVSVSDGTTTASFTDLAWRTSAITVGDFLSFAAQVDTAGETRAWSIDEIIISSLSIPGDTNNDGYVNAVDAAVLAGHWGQTSVTGGAEFGDFNGDTAVNAADASILAANWTGGAEGANAVPEPTALTVILGALLALAAAARRPSQR